jgi:hypothetical protein
MWMWLAVGRVRLPLCWASSEAGENCLDRLYMMVCTEDRHTDFESGEIVLAGGTNRADDSGLQSNRLALGQVLADQNPDFGTDLGRIGQLYSRTSRREFEEGGRGSEESSADVNRMADQNALSNSAFWTAIDFVEQEKSECAGMDRASDDHRDADAIEVGDEGSTRVVDDGDRSRPETQIRGTRFEEPLARNDHEPGTFEFFGIGEVRAEFVHGHGEFFEQVGKFGEFTTALKQHGPIAWMRGGGRLTHEVALSFLHNEDGRLVLVRRPPL